MVYEWAYKLGIPRGGDTVIYTGALYQLLPYIRALASYLSKLEETAGVTVFLRVARKLGLEDVLARTIARVSEEDIRRQYEILERIALLLRRAGVDYGYLYEDDVYPGTVLYLLGLEDELRDYAREVYGRLKALNVKMLITVDPHTTHLMKHVYREMVEGYDIQVKSYVEVLAERELTPIRNVNSTIVIHDPCYYARYLNVVEEPRKLLRRGGLIVKDVARSGRLTSCCGGPLEFITPRLAESITRLRLEELKSAGENIVTLCPICYLRFSIAGNGSVSISDLADYLYTIYGD